MNELLQSLGEDNLAWSPAFADYKIILEQLKSKDEMAIYEAVTTLQSQLSVAQENTLSNFTLDQYIPALIEILRRPAITDISNEINMFAVQCLTNLMDIFPQICNQIINHGGVKCLCELLERSMGFIDLNESCIKAFDKISVENPYAILTSGAMTLCLNMMDFFEFTTQKRIIQILLNISRHSASEQDFDDYIMPAIPVVCMLLQMRNEQGEERIEHLSSIILRICESFVRFFSPHSQFDHVSLQYEKLSSTGIFEAMIQSLYEYSIMSQAAQCENKNSQDKASQKLLTPATIQNFLRILSLCCRFSAQITKQLLDYDVFKLLDGFLPSPDDHRKHHYSSDRFPFTLETISLLDVIFPERVDSLKSENDKMREPVENAKRGLYSSLDQSKIGYIAEKLLPKVFYVYENNISPTIRIKTLQIIDKMIYLFNEELLNNFIEPYSFAKFIYANFRAQHPNSIQLCLQIIQKLIQSNPKTYTLPLIREGVVEWIKKLKTQESLEENLNFKISDKSTIKEEAESIIQAKIALLGQAQPVDEQQRQHFEQTLQRYLEAAKIAHSTSKQEGKSSKEICDSIISLSNTLCNKYFENEQFLNSIKSYNSNEAFMLDSLRDLAQQIKNEATQIKFDYQACKKLMNNLAECLTNQRHVMCYEFKQSGLLEALELYLTYSPNQARMLIEQKKAQEKGEEMKRSEEMQIQSKDGKKISKKEARVFIQRLKMFTYFVLNKLNGKRPFNELVQLCHDLLSQSESQIFQGQAQSEAAQVPSSYGGGFLSSSYTDINQSVNALKQLTRRVRVNLIYDPNKKFINQIKQVQEEETITANIFGDIGESPLSKAKSHHPAFLQLGGGLMEGAKTQSKVFIKRNFLFSELKQVLISVEQCASIWLLEDFLRNKIKNMDDVRSLKTPPSFLENMRVNQKSKPASIVMEKAMLKMREVFESGSKSRSNSEDMAQVLADEILNAKDLTEDEQHDIIRQLELQTLQMMDELYAAEDSQIEEMRESFEDRMLSGEGEEDADTEQRLYEFQRTLEKLRQTFKEKKQAATSGLKQPFLSKDEEMEDLSEDIKREENTQKDVEMTDEEDEQKKEIEEAAHKFLQQRKPNEIELSATQESTQHKEVLNQDLEELIKANGEDIEFEFYIGGQLVNQNMTLFEVLKTFSSNPGQKSASKTYSNYYSAYSTDNSTIYFTIKDKQDLNVVRKDSILEFASKRERAKSEAVDDISVSSINCIVQQLIDKEFQVFQKDIREKQKQPKQEDIQLEQCLKILKVLNFICKNSHLLSNQGIKFLFYRSHETEEAQVQGFSDYDLQIALSEIHPHVFHHHKLDSYIVRNIQDPYNLIGGVISDTLQQIFRNCPFLFPFSTRQLFFKLISFIGAIDMNRSIYFLRQFLKQRGGKVAEDKNTVKISKQKAIVDRTRILDSAFSLMKQLNKRAFLEIEYKDEIGTGLGPTLEFYSILAEDIKTKKQEIWRKGVSDNSLFPAPISMQKLSNEELQKVYEIFRLAGTMMAKSIVDDRLIDLPISPLWWDLLLGKKMNLFDLERLDKDLFKIFADLQLLANQKREIDKQNNLDPDSKLRKIHALKTTVSSFFDYQLYIQQGAHVEDLGFYFTFPGSEHIELKLNGKDIQVNIHNLQEFIDLFMHYTFHETIKVQTSAFKKGFNSIFPIDSLKPFSTTIELEDMICGTSKNEDEWKNPQRLIEHIVPAHGYHTKSQEYLNFIRFMTELDPLERRKFLKFVTGSPRLPHGGFASLEPRLTVVLKKPINPLENPDFILPSVMTCQNYVKLPSYSSYEILKKQFETAYNEGCNSFTLS